MKRSIRRIGLAGVAIGVLGFAKARRDGAIPGLVTHRFNPLVTRYGLAGGRRSPWGLVEHVGRTTGTTYRTPISIVGGPIGGTIDDQVYVRLTYGSGVHWVRNVERTGRCRLQLHETVLDLDEPTVVGAAENVRIPAPLRSMLERSGRTYLRLHVAGRHPGTLDDAPGPESPESTAPEPISR